MTTHELEVRVQIAGEDDTAHFATIDPATVDEFISLVNRHGFNGACVESIAFNHNPTDTRAYLLILLAEE